jgi:hypothetical protein
MSSRARDVALVLALTLFLGVLYGVTQRDGHDWGGDFSVYLQHARNLVEGKPYRTFTFQVTAESGVNHPGSYPPLFPVLLAPIYARVGLDYRALKMVPAALFLVSWILYYAAARVWGAARWQAALAVLITGASGIVLPLKESIVSDSSYLVFGALAVLTLLLLERRGWDQSHPVAAGSVAGVVIFVSYAARSVGLAFLPALVLYDLWKFRKPRGFSICAILLFAALLIPYTLFLYDSRSYGSQFQPDLSMYAANVNHYLRIMAAVWTGAPAWLRYPAAGIFLLLALIGWAKSVRSEPSIVDFSTLSFTGMVVVYTAGNAPRYLLPVVPFLLLYSFRGLDAVVNYQGLAARFQPMRLARLSVVLLALTATAVNAWNQPRGPITEGVAKPTFLAACDYLRANTSDRNLIIAWNPRVIAFYTGRPTALFPHSHDMSRFEQELNALGATHILVYSREDVPSADVGWFDRYYAYAADRLRLVHENGEFKVYQRSQD